MKNLTNMKKLKKVELKTIKGGLIPIGCTSWDPRKRCCRSWDDDHMNNPVCPEI